MGFAIPLQQLFHGSVVWRGMVYTVLMVFGKCATSVWLFLFPPISNYFNKFIRIKPNAQSERPTQNEKTAMSDPVKPIHAFTQMSTTSEATSNLLISADSTIQRGPRLDQRNTVSTPQMTDKEIQVHIPETITGYQRTRYAAFLLSFAMTVRGEIGFLIAAVGQGIDILAPEEVYLVVIWAVVMCTLLGSIGVGIIVYMIKRKTTNEERATQLLGIWG